MDDRRIAVQPSAESGAPDAPTLLVDPPTLEREPEESLASRYDRLLQVVPAPTRPRDGWERHLVRVLVAVDLVAVCASIALTWLLRHSYTNETLALFGNPFPYSLLVAIAIPAHLLSLVFAQAYERSVVGGSPIEYRRIVRAVVGLFVLFSSASFLGGILMSRAVMAVFFPLLLVFGLLGRYTVRKLLHRRRARGLDLRRTVLVGRPEPVAALVSHLERSPHAGYEVVGAYVPGVLEGTHESLPSGIALFGVPDQLIADLADLDIDTIALCGGHLFSQETMRSLAWRLHATGIQLLMAPDLTEIAGPRIVTRPVAGLPMLLVEEPRLDGWGHNIKFVVDRLSACVGLLLLSPLLAAIAIAIKRDSDGPVLYRQTRVARNGSEFAMLKFRSMVVDADQQLEALADTNDHDGVLFKMRDDPRVTRVGRFLRRYSLDELPQLINVARGEMAVVGPRPPLPSEVEQYGREMVRRLMVRPGITGLWQVSGRADLSWEDTVRLDLYYVENWSLTLDLVILAKTARAVLTGSGAY